MAVQRRDIFASHVPVAVPNYDLLQGDSESGRQSTTGAHGDESAHGDVASYQRVKAAATGEKPGGSAGFGLQGHVDASFSTADYNGSETGSDTSGYGQGIAGELPLSTSTFNGSDEPGEGSEYGKGIGGEVDSTLTLKKGI